MRKAFHKIQSFKIHARVRVIEAANQSYY